MVIPLQAFDRLLEVTVLLQRDLVTSLGAIGLTTARAHLLWELHRLGPSTQQTLAVALRVSPRNITCLVDAVEAAGFAQRQDHPTDRRATLVVLTDRGRQTVTEMEHEHEVAAEQLFGDLEKEQLEQFTRTLNTVAERLRRLVEAAEINPRRSA